MKKLGIYIHIPFCVEKCRYCDFLSFAGVSAERMEAYVRSLIKEIKWYGSGKGIDDFDVDTLGYQIDTIFIGGGTPSLIKAELIGQIMESLRQDFVVASDAEITIEANPKTISKSSLQTYRDAGINRISMGVQSLDNGILSRLGRIHTAEDFLENFWEARAAGFNNINVDLIFGIPGQSIDDWMDTLSKTVALKPEHLSFYSLKIEEGTPFFDMRAQGLLNEVDDDLDRRMYAEAVRYLEGKDSLGERPYYQRYEFSNAAKEGYFSRHNLKYWSLEDYLGIGLGAHSYIDHKRFSNTTEMQEYLASSGSRIVSRHSNSLQDDRSEFIFTGMRKISGIRFDEFERRFGDSILTIYKNEIEAMSEQGLILVDKNGMRLTDRGIDISNYVLSEFV